METAEGAPAPISSPSSARCGPVPALGGTLGTLRVLACVSLPSARSEAAGTMTLGQGQCPGTARPPHPRVLLILLSTPGTGRCCFPSPFLPGWPLPAKPPQACPSSSPGQVLALCQLDFFPALRFAQKLHLPEQPVISFPLFFPCVTRSERAAGRGSSSVSRSCHPSGGPLHLPSLLHNQRHLFPTAKFSSGIYWSILLWASKKY